MTPSLDLCISDLYEPGNIPADSGQTPSVPLPYGVMVGTASGVGAASALPFGFQIGRAYGIGAATGVPSPAGIGSASGAGTAAAVFEIVVLDPWTPAEISTLAWYDASDAGNVTLTGSSVDQWDDLSGNGNHVTQTSTNRPVFDNATNTINGLSVITFDGSDDYLTKASISGFPATVTTAITMVCIARHRGDFSSTERALFDISDGALTNRTALTFLDGNIGSNNVAVVVRSADNNQASFTSTPYDTSRVDLWSSLHQLNKRQAWRGGDPGTASTAGGVNYNYTNLRIGRLFQDVFAWGAGEIGEIVIFQGENDTNRQLIEGYLAWKWGIEAQLVSGHPYESAAPTL